MTSTTVNTRADAAPQPRRDRTKYLYLAVIVAVVLGIIVGFVFPDFGKELKPLGDGFVNLIKMMISPIIFCTIVLGIGSVRQAAKVGKVGGLALGYFLVMSTVALTIGLVVGNILHPGSGLDLESAAKAAGGHERGHGRLPARHHPDHDVLRADQRQGAADAVRGAAGRLRAAGDGPHRRADPARDRAPAAAGVPRARDDHVGGADRRVRRDRRGGRRDRLEGARRAGPDHDRVLPHLRDLRVRRAVRCCSSW